MSDWYPMMYKIAGRKCVVVGGGTVAGRKAAGLLEAQASVYVISPKLSPELRDLADAGKVRWLEKEAEDSDLDDAVLVFAATDDPEANRRLAEAAGSRAIPANLADDGDKGDFIVPAVLRRGGLVLTASTSGAGPALASRIVSELAERYGPEYNENVEVLRTIRSIVKSEVSDPAERRAMLQVAVTDEALHEFRSASWLKDMDKPELIARLRQRVNDRKG
ncbi:precorrin-2 dehydrogenase/sirohydrochlorin ferrochelatase family protein [Cohnella herbarum]|uniref:precorrin-2 dehydrogenase n=1 Tax=Cohnella herbarum TaxID=2728023 RepID=A0A7Z2VES3_9BACL|nr:bifunctional precorrin-2 dehydrogenase/sirohydrochlorin ferrochelatase [Cohnella herbarum]QJD81782.1 bifunctional precorrin-2 dehydrogenase/sirohydrochlorin ferrochelatase [Cohnella herbarum]